MWRWKAGDTLAEARRTTVVSLARTDEIIAEHRGEITPELIQSLDNNVIRGLQEDLQEQQLMPKDIWPRHSAEDAHRLIQVQSGEGSKTFNELIKLAVRLKQPAPSTINNWNTTVSTFTKVIKVNDVTELTEEHTRKYRDHLLDTVSGSTTKTRINTMRAMIEVAREEGWIESNPFDCIELKYIKSQPKQKKATSLDAVDIEVLKLSPDEQVLYWIMRYTGTHVSEAAGLMREDIDLKNGVIYIRPNTLRPIKNNYRQRELPIVKTLVEKLADLPEKKGHLFIEMFDSSKQRWGHKLSWQWKLGISPKACRDNVATVLRDAEVNERVIGSILGHTPQNSTGVYGSVSLEAKLKALNHLVRF
ncbi:tyrosine-type recombinase/integrase [Synechococcus sp. MIT S1220]|uniref:tyrosine-type recombinase/integrase n=1 Tax=Synechococcus sp. MIT S1220 TaxID=3082549 RepID=UPI0039B0BA19